MDGIDVESTRMSIQSLPDEHRDIFTRAIANILSSPIAEATYAQIIDGLPICDVMDDNIKGEFVPGHPIYTERLELSASVLEQARQLRSNFDASTLRMESSLLHDYRTAPPGSRAFHTLLIELAAVAVHQITVWLSNQEPNIPADHPLVTWRPPEEEMAFCCPGCDYPPTLFQHDWYCAYDKYPNGVADGIGYWAESRIFGGVVLFDRRPPGTYMDPEMSSSLLDVDPDAVYLHPSRWDVTYRIVKMLDDQKHQLVQFLLSEPEDTHKNCPLPIIANKDNRQRVDPEEPPEISGIYRDVWERSSVESHGGDRRLRDVGDTFNYLSLDDWQAATHRAIYARRRKIDAMNSD